MSVRIAGLHYKFADFIVFLILNGTVKNEILWRDREELSYTNTSSLALTHELPVIVVYTDWLRSLHPV